jgi:plastocyanin
MIPSDNEALTPTVKLSLASTAAASDVTSAFTIANQVTFNIEAGTGTARPHAGTLPLPNSRLTIHNGTKVIFHNADGTSHRIHADGGITHEPDELTTGNDYVATPTSNASWYCHDHENPMAGDTRIIEVIP